MSEQIKILEIPFTQLREMEILKKISSHLSDPSAKQLFIATPNPEMLLACRKNLKFKQVLQNTGINLPDGNGLIWAHRFNKKMQNIKNKLWIVMWGGISLPAFIFHSKNERGNFQKAIHGSDLTLQICQNPAIAKHGVFFLGNKNGLQPNTAELAAKKLKEQYPDILISGFLDTLPDDSSAVDKINGSNAKILFAAFGAPNQELWIQQNLPKLKSVKVAMGVGGTFDFIAGVFPRAPQIMRKTGFEWLYRLFKQPKRLKRIINAVLIFPYTVIINRLNQKK